MATPTFTLPTSGSDPKVATKEGLEENINQIIQYLDNARISGDAALMTGLEFQGGWDASTGLFPNQDKDGNTITKGGFFWVAVEGTFGGETYSVNEPLVAVVDNPSTTTTSDWYHAPINPSLVPVISKLDNLPVGVPTFADLGTQSVVDGQKYLVKDTGYWYTGTTAADPHVTVSGKKYYVSPLFDGSFALDAFAVDGTRSGDSSAIRIAARAAEGAPIRLSNKRYYYDGTTITRDVVRIIGCGMPAALSDYTALELGSIIDGTLPIVGDIVELRDFGVDCGSASDCDEDDGIRVSAGTLNEGKLLVVENLTALGKSRSSVQHALLFQGFQKALATNLEGIYTKFGIVFKCNNVLYDRIVGTENSSSCIIFKSDTDFGTAGRIQGTGARAIGYLGTDVGIHVQASGEALRYVQLDNSFAENCEVNYKFQVGSLGPDVREVSLSDSVSRQAYSQDILVENLAASGDLFNINVSDFNTIETRQVAIETSGDLNSLRLNNININYRVEATQLQMDDAIQIGTGTDFTEIHNVTTSRNYNRAYRGGITYRNGSGENILGASNLNILGSISPQSGQVLQSISGTSVSLEVPLDFLGTRTSSIRVSPTTSGSEVTSFSVEGSSRLQRGHTVTIKNTNTFAFTMKHNVGSGIINTNATDFVLMENQATSYWYDGTAWCQI